jgi:hypothetical protein
MYRENTQIGRQESFPARPSRRDAGPCYLGEPSVVVIDDDLEQLLDAPARDRCDDPELSKVRG